MAFGACKFSVGVGNAPSRFWETSPNPQPITGACFYSKGTRTKGIALPVPFTLSGYSKSAGVRTCEGRAIESPALRPGPSVDTGLPVLVF